MYFPITLLAITASATAQYSNQQHLSHRALYARSAAAHAAADAYAAAYHEAASLYESGLYKRTPLQIPPMAAEAWGKKHGYGTKPADPVKCAECRARLKAGLAMSRGRDAAFRWQCVLAALCEKDATLEGGK